MSILKQYIRTENRALASEQHFHQPNPPTPLTIFSRQQMLNSLAVPLPSPIKKIQKALLLDLSDELAGKQRNAVLAIHQLIEFGDLLVSKLMEQALAVSA